MTRASMPGDDYRRPLTLEITRTDIVVTVIEEGTGRRQRFEFHTLPIGESLQQSFAEGFARATGPGGGRRTLPSAQTLWAYTRRYSAYLESHTHPPSELAALRPMHIDELRKRHTQDAASMVHALRVILRSQNGVPAAFLEKLLAPLPAVTPKTSIAAYSPSEFRGVRRALRGIVRDALHRIRAGEQDLVAAERKEPDSLTDREQILIHFSKTSDVPRRPGQQARHRGSQDVVAAMVPSFKEVTAVVLLLQCMTGQNVGTLLSLRTTHHRADDQDTEPPLVQARTVKPRRGPSGAEQDSVFDSADVWSDPAAFRPGPDSSDNPRDDFNSAAGVFNIALELCARARRVAGTDRLFVGYSPKRPDAGSGPCRPLQVVNGFTSEFQWRHRGQERAGIDSRRIRRAYLEQRQRPVDHKERTLADAYLLKDSGSRGAYQKVVAETLSAEVSRIEVASMILTLTEEQVQLAFRLPDDVAKAIGVAPQTLSDTLAGRLDTVATSCIDNANSPYSKRGAPCSASFLLCLGCPNALAEPRHLPVLVALQHTLQLRQSETTAADWEAKFGTPSRRLKDIIERLAEGGSLIPRHSEVEPRIHELVEALVDGRLDLR